MKMLTTEFGAPVDNQNIQTAGPRGPALLQDVWFFEKLAHLIAKSSLIAECMPRAGAHGNFVITHDITRDTCAKIFSGIGKKSPMFACFRPSTSR
jgi:catalase